MQRSFGERVRLLGGTALVASLAATATVLATTYTNGGLTLEVPSYPQSAPLSHCEPQNDPTADKITLSGIPEGSTVMLNYMLNSGVAGSPITNVSQTFTGQSGTASYSIPYPEDTTQWPYQDSTIRAINVAVSVAVIAKDGKPVKVSSKPWRVVCKPTPPDDPPPTKIAGCTPGYWRQVGDPWSHSPGQHLDSWGPTGYHPADSFDDVFGVSSSFGDLGTVVNSPGGGHERQMAFHAVAALLNAAHPDVPYPMTTGEVIGAVQAAYLSGDFAAAHNLFEGYNEIGCPLD